MRPKCIDKKCPRYGKDMNVHMYLEGKIQYQCWKCLKTKVGGKIE